MSWDDYLERLGAFAQAQTRGDPALRDAAGDVRLHATSVAPTVREAVAECMRHRWNAQIYEAWAAETLSRVRRLMRSLPDLVAEAIAVFADVPGLERDAKGAWEAIEEAREAMYAQS